MKLRGRGCDFLPILIKMSRKPADNILYLYRYNIKPFFPSGLKEGEGYDSAADAFEG